jgi:hypothetical protein
MRFTSCIGHQSRMSVASDPLVEPASVGERHDAGARGLLHVKHPLSVNCDTHVCGPCPSPEHEHVERLWNAHRSPRTGIEHLDGLSYLPDLVSAAVSLRIAWEGYAPFPLEDKLAQSVAIYSVPTTPVIPPWQADVPC